MKPSDQVYKANPELREGFIVPWLAVKAYKALDKKLQVFRKERTERLYREHDDVLTSLKKSGSFSQYKKAFLVWNNTLNKWEQKTAAQLYYATAEFVGKTFLDLNHLPPVIEPEVLRGFYRIPFKDRLWMGTSLNNLCVALAGNDSEVVYIGISPVALRIVITTATGYDHVMFERGQQKGSVDWRNFSSSTSFTTKKSSRFLKRLIPSELKVAGKRTL